MLVPGRSSQTIILHSLSTRKAAKRYFCEMVEGVSFGTFHCVRFVKRPRRSSHGQINLLFLRTAFSGSSTDSVFVIDTLRVVAIISIAEKRERERKNKQTYEHEIAPLFPVCIDSRPAILPWVFTLAMGSSASSYDSLWQEPSTDFTQINVTAITPGSIWRYYVQRQQENRRPSAGFVYGYV